MPGWEAIVPKRKVIDVTRTQARLSAELGSFLIDANRMCADYEAPPSESYTRTNRLKTSWSKEGPKTEGRDLVGIVKSAGHTAPYNIWVRGPRGGSPGQAAHMRRRGWLSIDDILKKLWPPTERRLRVILGGH